MGAKILHMEYGWKHSLSDWFGSSSPGLRDPYLRDPYLRDPYLRDPYLRDPDLRDPYLSDPYLRYSPTQTPPASDMRPLSQASLPGRRLQACRRLSPASDGQALPSSPPKSTLSRPV